MSYPDRPPTRDEKRAAIAMGLLHGQRGDNMDACRFKHDGGVFEREMRSYWRTGWVDAQAERIPVGE